MNSHLKCIISHCLGFSFDVVTIHLKWHHHLFYFWRACGTQYATELMKSVFNIWTSLCSFGVEYVKVFSMHRMTLLLFPRSSVCKCSLLKWNTHSSNVCTRTKRSILKSSNKKRMVRMCCAFSLLDKRYRSSDFFLFSPQFMVYGSHWESLNKRKQRSYLRLSYAVETEIFFVVPFFSAHLFKKRATKIKYFWKS